MRDSNVCSSSGPATPSLIACSATALATANDTERSSETGGNNRPDLLHRAGESSARHLAAAMNIVSVTRRASTDRTPKPIPGKMYVLFVWSIGTWRPLQFTAANGLPG